MQRGWRDEKKQSNNPGDDPFHTSDSPAISQLREV
jgi:hypothetical protein